MIEQEIFHHGEKQLQEIAGKLIPASFAKRIVKASIMPGAINFIENQKYFLASSMDTNKDIWISIILGKDGFLKVENESLFFVDKSKVVSTKTDIFYDNILQNQQIGSLFIELASRRRYRINSEVSLKDNLIYANIKEAYANCPKYIQKRFIEINTAETNTSPQITKDTNLNSVLEKWILNADTFFVGSCSDDQRMDASHRGGKKGFIAIEGNTLRIPDYVGNNLYNTLGNFVVNKNGGLLFVDFETGDTLQLTGTIDKIQFEQNSEADLLKSGGTGRFWTFKIKKWIHTKAHHTANWQFVEDSPFNP